MNPIYPDQLTPMRLARLLSVDLESGWSQEDAIAALRHQLDAPLLPDLLQIEAIDGRRLERAFRNYSGPLHFGAQLNAKMPNTAILLAIREFSEQVGSDLTNPLAGNAARVLYFASTAALIRVGYPIDEFSESSLAERFRWAAKQPGARVLQELFASAIDTMRCSVT